MKKNSYFKINIILLILLFILLRLPFLSQEFTTEEPHIVKAATAIATTGYPKIYLGEQTGEIVNLWKPPGLVLILALAFKLFGVSEITARSVPLLFSLGQLLLIIFFVKKLFKPSLTNKIAILAGLFFVLHPYTIQTSTQVDIDGGVLAFFTSLMMFAGYYLTSQRFQIKSAMLWFFLVHLAFMTKFEPTLMLLTLLTFFCLIDKNRRQSLLWLLPITILSIGVFFFWFSAYNSFFVSTQSTSQSINVIINVFKTIFLPKFLLINHQSLFAAWRGSLTLATRFFSWLTAPFIALLITQLIAIYSQLTKKPEYQFLILWAGGLTFIYFFFGYVGFFPRYFAPAMPAIFLLLAAALITQINYSPHWKLVIFSSLVWLMLLYNYHLPLARIMDITQYDLIMPVIRLAVILIVIFIIITYLLNKTTAITLLCIFTISTFLFLWRNDVKAGFSLTNEYGNWGNKLAGQVLKSQLTPQDIIITTDPIAYYYGYRYYDVNLVFPYPDKSNILVEKLKGSQAVALPLTIIAGYLENPNHPITKFISSVTNTPIQVGTILIFLK